jgi:hypothetical protein
VYIETWRHGDMQARKLVWPGVGIEASSRGGMERRKARGHVEIETLEV